MKKLLPKSKSIISKMKKFTHKKGGGGVEYIKYKNIT